MDDMIKDVAAHLEKTRKELESPFIPEAVQAIALEAVTSLLEDLKLRREDCNRLLKLTE